MVGREGNGGGHSRFNDGTGRKVSIKQNEKRNLLCMENVSDSGGKLQFIHKNRQKVQQNYAHVWGSPNAYKRHLLYEGVLHTVRNQASSTQAILYAAAVAVVRTSFDLQANWFRVSSHLREKILESRKL